MCGIGGIAEPAATGLLYEGLSATLLIVEGRCNGQQHVDNRAFVVHHFLNSDWLIVSQVTVKTGGEPAVEVARAEGGKCERCWKILPAVGSDAEHPTLCPRCAAAVRKLPQF